MAERPAGTVTLLFTDVEGSTRLLQTYEQAYPAILTAQRAILREAAQQYRGHEVDARGEEVFVAFPRAKDALAAALAAQRALQQHSWPEGAAVRVRMGLHTGEPVITDTGYVGEVRAKLPPHEFTHAMDTGRTMTPEQAVTFAKASQPVSPNHDSEIGPARKDGV